MDDNELEARLRTHLHRRFDKATPSPELTASVQQVLRTEPKGVGLRHLRLRRSRALSWSLVGVAGLVGILAVAAIQLGNVIGPGDRGSGVPPSSSVSPITERPFMVVPPSDRAATAAETNLAAEVLTARLRALGFDTPTRTNGDGIGYLLPVTGPTDTQIYHALTTIGEVEFVPLPPEDYGEGKLVAEVGAPLPKDEPALFGWDGIASVEWTTDEQSRRTALVTLTPGAREAFASHTENHIGEFFAVLIDDRVALLPVINEPILGGEVQISGGRTTEDFEETVAILVGGALPVSWRGAQVPEIIPEHEITAGLLREADAELVSGDPASLVSAELDAIDDGSGWIAVWRIVLRGEFEYVCTAPAVPTCTPFISEKEFVLDADSGDVVATPAPPG
jgi:hypothetical protein